MEILMSMVFLITLFLPDCLNLQPSGEILIISPNHTEIDAFESENALFGRKIPSSSSEQGFLYDVPHNACVKLDIKLPEEDIPFYAVYKRRSCPDDLQAFNLQNASFAGAIFYDERDEDTFIRLKAKDRDRHIHIYVTFVPQRTAKELREKYLFHSKCQAMILSQQKDFFNFKAFIIAAGTLGSLALFGVIAAWSIHLCYNCYKKRKARLPIRRLQQLETKSFAKGDPYEVCAICLEAYEETEVLRILPCRHAYHKTCVDPWLTQNKRICPVCKQAVLREDDPNYPIASSRSSNSERTPLLGAEGGEISSPEISTSLGSRIRTLFSRKRRNSGSSDDLENSRTAITTSTSNDTRPNYASINSVEESEARINYGSFYSANDLNDSSSFYQSAREDQLNTSSGNFQTPTSSRFASANQSYDSLTTHTITPGVKEMENVEFWDVTEPDESYVTEDEKKNDTLSIGSFKDCQEASVEFVDNSKSPSEQHESI